MPKMRLTFSVDGDKLIGDLHLPEATSIYPAVMVAGPMTSVKEQVTGTYAAALATKGIAALAIDHRHYGESGGVPRSYEYYPHKIKDLQVSFDILKQQKNIDPNKIGAVGVCLGCGYMAHAIANRNDIKFFAGVAGYYRDVEDMKGQNPESFDKTVAQGREAREYFEKTGGVMTIPAVSLNEDAAMMIQSTYDYYAGRAAHPNYKNEFAVMSREHFIQFDVQPAAKSIASPFMMIHSENALNPKWAKKFYENVETKKQYVNIEAPNQTTIYDDGNIVDVVTKHIVGFCNSLDNW